MSPTLFILSTAAYGDERAFDKLPLAGALAARDVAQSADIQLRPTRSSRSNAAS